MMTRFPSARLLPAAFFLLALAFPASAQDPLAGALFPDPVVATGKGFEIKRSAVEDAFITEKGLVLQQQNVSIPESDRARVESDILLHLVIDKILTAKATEDEKTRTRDEVEKYLDDLRKAAPSEELFQQQITSTGKTLAQIKAGYLEKRLARVVLVRELVPSNAISDAAVKKFYEDEKNATNFAIPELVHVAHILISVLDPSVLDPATRQPLPLPPAQKREKEMLARDIKAKADKGDDFATLAKLYSDDTSTKYTGGEHTFARHAMAPALEGFEAAAFSLKTNQISDLVETPYGYHIIKLLERLPPSRMSLDKVTAGIRDYLADVEINKMLPAYIPKIEAEYDVKFLGPNFSPTPLVPPAAPTAPAAPAPFIGPPAPPEFMVPPAPAGADQK
jgi:parvulin-like peptidyl-prolyl isomerase